MDFLVLHGLFGKAISDLCWGKDRLTASRLTLDGQDGTGEKEKQEFCIVCNMDQKPLIQGYKEWLGCVPGVGWVRYEEHTTAYLVTILVT